MMIDNAAQQRFELRENGLLVFANYRRQDQVYVLTHVEADPVLRGTGAASRLMQAIADHARANKLKLVPRCSYAVIWMKRHPEQSDLIE
jgi:predicted GNAT family acetyltransferase